MAAESDQAAHQQQHHQQQQQDQQQSSALLETPRLMAALLGHHSIGQDQNVLLALSRSSKQLQAAAAAQCAGQLAVSRVLHVNPAVDAQGFDAWLRRHACLLRELHVELRCLGSGGFAVLQCLQEQEQQLQALQGLTLDNMYGHYPCNGVRFDWWAKPLLLHLPVGLKRLQLTGRWPAAQQDALAAFGRLQQLTQLTISDSWTSALQHVPAGLRSLDLRDRGQWVRESGRDALAPLAGLQQLTELHLGKVRPEQLGQLPPSLQQLDLTLAVNEENYRQATAWFQQHAGILRRLVLDGGGCCLWRWDTDTGRGTLRDRWAVPLAGVAAAFEAAATAAAAAAPGQPGTTTAAAATAQPAAPVTDTTPNTTSSSSSSRFALQLMRALGIPWVLNGANLRTLPGSLTELECYIDLKCEQAVDALSSLTQLRSLCVKQNKASNALMWHMHSGCSDLSDQHDCALAPLSALMHLTRLELPYVRAQQLEQLQLPRLQQPTATVARRNRSDAAADHRLGRVHLSHFSSLKLLDVSSNTLLQSDAFGSSLRTVTLRLLRPSSDRVPAADAARLSLQPLLQLGCLDSLSLEFYDLRPDMCHSGLLHELHGSSGGCCNSRKVWRMAASTAEQGVAGDPEPAAAGVLWGALPLKSVRLDIIRGMHGFVRMPMPAVHALGALPLTELVIRAESDGSFLTPGLDVTPAQLGKVLQRLPLLQQLVLDQFVMLCDERAFTGTEAQQQQQLDAEQQQQHENKQQGMQPYHSAAGVSALVSAVAGLPRLHKLYLTLPLRLQPAAAQQVDMGQLLCSGAAQFSRLQDAVWISHIMWLRAY
jgi:hypothetical protein